MKLAMLCAAASGVAMLLAATPALAEMGACESAIVNKTPAEEVRLYTICMERLPARAMAGALHNRGVAHLNLGDLESAERDFNASLRYDNRYGLAYFNRSLVYARYGETDRALADLERTLDALPSRVHSAARLRRASLLHLQGDYVGAIADLDQVIARRLAWFDPDGDQKLNDRAEAQRAKALILATATDASVRNGAEAVALAQRALERADNASGRMALAAAYAEMGQFADATREQQLAMQMAAQEDLPADPKLALQLAAYEAGQPYREAPGNCGVEATVACSASWAHVEGMRLRVGRISAEEFGSQVAWKNNIAGGGQ